MISMRPMTIILSLAATLILCAVSAHAEETPVFTTSPAQDADHYAASGDTLYAFDAEGEPLWSCAAGAVIRSSPVIWRDGLVYMLTGTDSLTAIGMDGDVYWTLGGIAPSAETIALSSDGVIYIGGGNGLSALSYDGGILWQWSSGREGEDNAYVSVAYDGTIYVTGTTNTHLYALNPSGALLWEMESPTGEPFSAPAIGGEGMAYVTCGGEVLAIAPDNTVAWTCAGVNGRPFQASPVIGKGDTVYVTDDEGLVHVITSSGEISVTISVGAACATGPVLGNDGMAYQCATNGDIYRIDPSTGDVAAVGSAGGSVQASPIITPGSALCFGVHEGALVTVGIDASGYPARAPWPCYGADNRNSRKMTNPPVGSLSGTVIFDGIGIPVLDAHITLSPGYQATTTGDDGRYTLTHIRPGTCTVTVEAFGMLQLTVEDVVITAWEDTELNLTPSADRKYLKWRFTKGYESLTGGPAVADDGTIFVGDRLGTLHALSADGDSLWIYEGTWPLSDPVLFDTGIVFTSGDTVHMLDRDGVPQWTYTADCEFYTPVRDPDGTVILCCSDATVRALNENGTLRWSSPLQYASRYQPAIGVDGTIYVTTNEGMVVALDRHGVEKWTYTCPGHIIGPPAMDNDGRLYLCISDGCMVLSQTGELEWSYDKEYTSTPPVIGADGVVYFGAREALCAVRSGRLVWQYIMTNRETVVAAPVVGADGFVYFGTNQGTICALTFEGHLTWRYAPAGGIPTNFKLTPGGVLLSTGQYAVLNAIQTRSYGYQEDAPWPCKGRDNRNTAVMLPGDNVAFIRGTVYHAADGKPIPGVTVRTVPDYIATVTNSFGEYYILVPAPGTYRVETLAAGWIKGVSGEFTLDVGNEVTVDFTLEHDTIWTRWRTYIGDAPSSFIRCAPAVADDGTIYVVASRKLTAVNPDGSINWSVDSGYSSTPVVAEDGTIYTTAWNVLTAFDPSGTELWSLNVTEDYSDLATPAIGYDGTIYVGNNQDRDKYIRAITPAGEIQWASYVGNHTYSPPIVGLDGTIYSGGQGSGLHALSPEGKKKWTYRISFDWIDSPPAAGPDNTIYCVQKSGLIHAINPDGSGNWNYKTQQEAISSPIIGPDNTLYFIDGKGELFALRSDGTVGWKLRGLMAKTTPVIDADGILYAAGWDGVINAIEEGTVLWRYAVGSSPAYDLKLGPDGVLYAFCRDGYLYAIQTESPGYPRESCWPCIFGGNRNVNRMFDGVAGGVIAGTVTDDTTDEGVENVLVAIEPGGLSTSTGADGSFTLRGVEPGTYTLTASAFGYVTKQVEGVTVEAGRTTAADIRCEPDDYSLKWTFDTHRDDEHPLMEAIMYSVALGHDGTVYVDNEFNLFAVSPEGEELWMARLEGRGRSVSVAADSTIYIGTEGEALQAFSPGGIELWRHNHPSFVEGTPSIGPNGRIYVPFDRNFRCLDPDGTEAWTIELDHCANTAAIAYDGTLYAGTNLDTFYAVSPEGEILWTGDARGNPPSLGRDGTVYTADGAMLRAISPDGVELWSYKADNRIVGSCAIDNGNNIYFGDIAGTFHVLDYEGRVLWKYDAGGMIPSSPAIGSDGIIYFGDSNGIFHALNPDGSAKWTFRTGSAIDGSPAIADDGTVYIGSFDSQLYAFQTASFGYQEGAPWPCYCHDSQRTSYMSSPPTVSVEDEDEGVPAALSLLPVRPNPFNMSAIIPFTVPSDGHVTLAVYNLAGQRIRTLVDGLMTAGTHREIWNGRDDNGQTVAAGVYLTRLEAMGAVVTGKMALVK